MNSKGRTHIGSLLAGVLTVKIILVFWLLSCQLFETSYDFVPVAEAVVQEPGLISEEGVTPDAGKEPEEKTPADTGKDNWTHLGMVMEGIEQKQLALKKQEAKLRKERQQIETIKQEVELRIDALSTAQKKLEVTLAAIKEKKDQQQQRIAQAEDAKIKQLVKVYTSMKPKTAAALVDKMDMNIVLEMFSRMKGEQIGQILSYVNIDRAARISESLARRKP